MALAGPVADRPVRQVADRSVGIAVFARLKLVMLANGLRGQPWRVVGFVFGTLFAGWVALVSSVGLAASVIGSDHGFVVASLSATVVVLGWTFVPLLFFGVDETLDPARLALLPLPRATVARGMLTSAFIGVAPVATLVAIGGIAAGVWWRYGWAAGSAALLGVLTTLFLGVLASRAITSAFAAMLRSRRVRDLAAVTIALLASAIGPIQMLVIRSAGSDGLAPLTQVATVVSWLPLGAPLVVGLDVATGHVAAALGRLAISWSTIIVLGWWWSRTLDSAMLATSTGSITRRRPPRRVGSAVRDLVPALVRPLARGGVFGAILARECRFWWRDPRRRASLVSIMMASAVLPIALRAASVTVSTDGAVTEVGPGPLSYGFVITMSGTMGGMLLANQLAFDGTAYAAHLLAHVRGRVEIWARSVAIALVAVPAQIAVVVAISLATGMTGRIGAGLGMLLAGFGAAVATAAPLSVLAPYALPDTANPFALNSGSGTVKGLLAVVAMLATLVISSPIIVAATVWSTATQVWLVFVSGLVYGVGVAYLGTVAAGAILDRRGPEVLVAITPRR